MVRDMPLNALAMWDPVSDTEREDRMEAIRLNEGDQFVYLGKTHTVHSTQVLAPGGVPLRVYVKTTHIIQEKEITLDSGKTKRLVARRTFSFDPVLPLKVVTG